ncbi:MULTISPECIES: hypothetical protein [unclassified Agrococcus]|uniref:hypothetical protein n=1 Tax=unclassified Agrococcus TaxID=2615065 RepID=UPI00361696FD
MGKDRLDGAAEEVRETLMAQFRRITDLHRKRARDRADKMQGDADAIRDLDRFDHMPDDLAAVHAMDNGSRPHPSTYFSEEDLDDHVSRFQNGGTRFMPRANVEKYGPAQADGTSFLMSTDEVDRMLIETGGDQELMERALGLNPGDLDGDLVRVDVPNPFDHGIRMPSGNERGANEHWLPGGTLPGGISEGVIDGGGLVRDVDYSVQDFVPGGQRR